MKTKQVDVPGGRPGGGLYDPECHALREQLEAAGVLLIVLGGNRRAADGSDSGFSVAATLHSLSALPDVLEAAARNLRAQLRAGTFR